MAGGETRPEALWETARAALARRFAPTLDARDQRHRRPPAHEPRPRPAAGGRAGRDPGSGGGLLDRRVRPGPRSPRPAAGPRAPAREGRLRLRRRDRRQQQRGRGPARPGGPRARTRGPRVARRARRDRRLVQDPRDPRGLGRPAPGSRNDQPHDGRRLSPALSRRRSRFCFRSTRRTTRSEATRGARRRRSSPASRAKPACRGSTTRARAAWSALEEFGVRGRAHGRRVPGRRRGPRHVLGRQALLGAAGGVPLRPGGARQARGRASGGARRASRQARARGTRRDARRVEDRRVAGVSRSTARRARRCPSSRSAAGGFSRARLRTGGSPSTSCPRARPSAAARAPRSSSSPGRSRSGTPRSRRTASRRPCAPRRLRSSPGVEDGTALLDLRSIAPEEDGSVAEALRSLSETRDRALPARMR